MTLVMLGKSSKHNQGQPCFPCVTVEGQSLHLIIKSKDGKIGTCGEQARPRCSSASGKASKTKLKKMNMTGNTNVDHTGTKLLQKL